MAARHVTSDGAAPDVLPRRPMAYPAVLAVLFAAAAVLSQSAPQAASSASSGAAPRPWAGGVFAPLAPSPPAQVGAAPPRPRSVPSRPALLAPPPLTVPGPVPAAGQGTFGYAAGTGRVHGTSGVLRRFRVAVERGAGEDVRAFAGQVEAALGDPRSWTGGGGLRLQRVGGGDPHDFTVYLATRETAGRMCLRGGVNIRVGGRPYTSCRAPGGAIINLDRWRLSAPTFTRAGVPLATYRAYVVNHEVGHELGRSHQGCPERGGPAPVMVQQTLTLRGCTPYPWPRRSNRLFTGPPLR
jgi:hypothetical protein